jgi:hypothetical protein
MRGLTAAASRLPQFLRRLPHLGLSTLRRGVQPFVASLLPLFAKQVRRFLIPGAVKRRGLEVGSDYMRSRITLGF